MATRGQEGSAKALPWEQAVYLREKRPCDAEEAGGGVSGSEGGWAVSPRLTLKCEACRESGTKSKQTVTTGAGTSALGRDGTQNSKAQ